MATTLGEKLRQRRKELRMSLDKLATASNTSKSYLWELENRDTRKPSAAKLTEIANALEVTTGYLVDENAQMDEENIKEAFFRKYNSLDKSDQQRLNQIIDAWGKKED